MTTTVKVTVAGDSATGTAPESSFGWTVAMDLYETLTGRRCNRTLYVTKPAGVLGTYTVQFGDNDRLYPECEAVFS